MPRMLLRGALACGAVVDDRSRVLSLLGPPGGPTREVVGVPILDGRVPEPWAAPISSPRVCADEQRVLVRQLGVGLYVEHGQRVVIEAADAAERLDFDYLAYALAARLVLIQRHRFTLHASLVISPDGQAVAITGDSMAGKSTATAMLIRDGWRFACDDTVEVEVAAGRATAVPHARPVHLADSAARLLGAEPAAGRHLPGRHKRAYALSGDLARRDLAMIVRLRAEGDGAPRSHRLSPPAAAPVVGAHSDMAGICHLPALRPAYFAWTTQLVSAVPVVDVVRPVGVDSVSAVADVIAAALDAAGS